MCATITVATGQSEEFAKEAQYIREKCMEERKEAEAQHAASSGGLMSMLGAAMGMPPHRSQEWQCLSVAVDSGAAETVIPYTLIKDYPIEETSRSRAGLCYASATGAPIPNLGEQKLPMATMEGSLRMMTFQAAPLAKPLGSVSRICQAGHVVVFDEDGSFIMNKTTGEINWLREDDGNYMLGVWIPPATALNEDQGFAWQPSTRKA